MGIKWKNSAKFCSWVLLLAFGLNALITFLNYGGNYIGKNYFQSHEFQYEHEQFLQHLTVFEINNISEELAIKNIKVTKEDIEEYRYRYGDLTTQIADINNQYENKIQEAIAIENNAIAEAYIEERGKLIEDITRNFSDDKHVYEKVRKEKEDKIKQYFEEREKHRATFENYKKGYTYYFEDVSTGEVFTNIQTPKKDSIDEMFNDNEMIFLREYHSYNVTNYDHIFYGELEIPSSVKGNYSYDGKIGITKEAAKSNPVWYMYHDYKNKQLAFFIYCGSGILAFILGLFLYRKLKIADLLPLEKWSMYYKKLPIDMALVLFIILGIVSFITLVVGSTFHYYPSELYIFLETKMYIIVGFALLLALFYIKIRLLFNRVKGRSKLRQEWKRSAILSIYRLLQGAFINRRVGTQVLLLLGFIFIIGVGGGIALTEVELFIVYVILFILVITPVIIIIAKKLKYFNQILSHVEQVSSGNLVSDLPVNGKSILAAHAKHINLLNQGVKASQNQQAKSERLKTELITNVSHDLRTPLTSIITYTELLKTPELSLEDQKAYVEIIDRKSKRLKVLIDDLFEASKMASGNIELDKTQVDLVSLLQQALAEHDEKISQSTLQFRVNHPHPPIYAEVDGQKMWRVLDNLIGNILKYSLENTRVYISILVEADHVVITFKNVTKYELGENVDELLERFKRGDTSRNTEGSGLGLAIAKSIIDLHEGRLDIDIDGDLFKVTIKLIK